MGKNTSVNAGSIFADRNGSSLLLCIYLSDKAFSALSDLACFIVYIIIISDHKTPNRHDVGLDVGLEKQILAIMADDSAVTLNAISNDLNVTKRTVERILRKLREEGIVERIGGKRYGSWKLCAEK